MGPLKFQPLLKRICSGGRRLGTVLRKPIGPDSDYAESWEICDRGADQTVVADGPWRNWELQRLVRERAHDLLGRHAGISQFPLLVKFLDARARLSVQVHPDDAQAGRYAPGERGKTEAWVILAAAPESCVFAGLRPGVDESALRHAVMRGTVEDCLNRVPVAAGDCLFIPAGTVHAIGEGVLLAEVQQSSDLTFRLFDWDRVGSDGKPRSLHISEALNCISFSRGPVNKITPATDRTASPACEALVRCPSFTIRRHRLREAAVIDDDQRCHVIVCLEGSIQCSSGEGTQRAALGDTVLVPASSLPARLIPESASVVLDIVWD